MLLQDADTAYVLSAWRRRAMPISARDTAVLLSAGQTPSHDSNLLHRFLQRFHPWKPETQRSELTGVGRPWRGRGGGSLSSLEGLRSWDVPVLCSQLLPAVTQQPSPQRLSFGCQRTLAPRGTSCTHRPKTYRDPRSFSSSAHSAGGGSPQRVPAWLVQSWSRPRLRQSSSKYFIIPN